MEDVEEGYLLPHRRAHQIKDEDIFVMLSTAHIITRSRCERGHWLRHSVSHVLFRQHSNIISHLS